VHNTTMMHTRDGFTDGKVCTPNMFDQVMYQLSMNENDVMIASATLWNHLLFTSDAVDGAAGD